MVKFNNRNKVLPDLDALTGTVSGKSGQASASTLDSLAPGQSASIAGITAEAGLRMHLMELGFVAGSPITFLMSTPFGDPHIYSLRGTSIALRKSEARCIQVTT